MAEDKRDWLSYCNETKVPFQDFIAGFCVRCFQPECTRSTHGKSRFEDRALNWENRLFNQVSKLDPSDERFKEIASKRFLPIAPSQASAPSAWMDPRDIEPSKEILIPAPAPAILVPEPAPPVVLAPTPPPPVVVPAQEVPRAPAPAAPPAEPVLRNTPAQQRQMIGGGDAKAPQPVLDPWQPKQPLRPDDNLVQPGARIKLGRS